MIAFGGAAPLHAGRLCEKLGVDRMLVPPGAGVGSAIGFLRAPFSFEANRSVYMKLSDFAPEKITQLLNELQKEATGFVRSCDATADILSDFKVYMRYTGQGWEIPITLTAAQAQNPDAETFQKLFEDDYTKLFGRPVEGMDVEITVWAVNATTPPQAVAKLEQVNATKSEEASSAEDRQMFDPALGESVTTRVVLRESVQTGSFRPAGALYASQTGVLIWFLYKREPYRWLNYTPRFPIRSCGTG